jgi:hypothetical protein
VTRKDRYWHVPKHVLAGALRSLLERGDVRIAGSLEHAALLREELLSFEVRIIGKAHETFEASPGSYDDLVIATALCLFLPTWLESQQPVIAGPGTRVLPPRNTSAAARALTQGGRITFPDRQTGGGRDRSGW